MTTTDLDQPADRPATANEYKESVMEEPQSTIAVEQMLALVEAGEATPLAFAPAQHGGLPYEIQYRDRWYVFDWYMLEHDGQRVYALAVTVEKMQALVEDGEARRFNRSLGGQVPDAVNYRGRWHVGQIGKPYYVLPGVALVKLLDDIEDPNGRFAQADKAVAEADVRAGR